MAVGRGVGVTFGVGFGVAVAFRVAVGLGVGVFVGRGVGVGVALACFFVMAELEFSFSRVFWPAFPSAVSPLAFWKAFTAASVAGPKSPSADPVYHPSSFSRRCSARTSSESVKPRCRLFGVGVGVAGAGVTTWMVGRGVAVAEEAPPCPPLPLPWGSGVRVERMMVLDWAVTSGRTETVYPGSGVAVTPDTVPHSLHPALPWAGDGVGVGRGSTVPCGRELVV